MNKRQRVEFISGFRWIGINIIHGSIPKLIQKNWEIESPSLRFGNRLTCQISKHPNRHSSRFASFIRTFSFDKSRLALDFLGVEDDKGKPDLLLKHLRRVQKIRDHSNQLTKFLKLPVAPKIEALLLFRNPVPMMFAWENVTSESAISTLANFESFLTNDSR